jgi:hypothetical protein
LTFLAELAQIVHFWIPPQGFLTRDPNREKPRKIKIVKMNAIAIDI